MRWDSLSLRGQIIVLVAIGALLTEISSATIDFMRVQAAHDEEVLNRGMAFLREALPVIAVTPQDRRKEVALSFATAERSIRIQDSNVARERSAPGVIEHRRLVQRIEAQLRRDGLPIKTLQAADAPFWIRDDQPSVFSDFMSIRHIAAPADMPPRRAHAAVYSVQLEGEHDWINFYVLLSPITFASIILERILDAFTALVLLGFVSFFIERITRPLSALTGTAQRLGRGEDVALLPVQGNRTIRTTTQAFNRMATRLKQSLNYQTSLLQSLGHDAKEPVSEIRAISEHVAPDDVREKLQRWVLRLEGLVESTLTFTRETRRDGETVRVDLTGLVEAIADEAQDAGQDVTLEKAEPAVVLGRHNALLRLFQNLVGNAVKYGGGARLSLGIDNSDAVVFVDDDGPGIDPAHLEDAFKPFERLGAEGSGTGLGLAIVRTIAVDHGGTVRLALREEGGLRAEVRLPLEPDQSRAAAEAARET